jgi:hypothetical protein
MTLGGLLEDDPPIRLVPELRGCGFTYSPYPPPEDPEERERRAGLGVTWRPEYLAEGDDIVVCHLDNGQTLEFVAFVASYPCIREPWLDGFNRKMVELMVADGNWPPADDERRLTMPEFFDSMR